MTEPNLLELRESGGSAAIGSPRRRPFHPVRRGRHLVRRDRAHCPPRTRTRPGPVTSARAHRRADPLGRVGRGLRRPAGSPRSTRPARGLAEPGCEQPQTGRFPFFECAGDPSHLLVRGRKVVDRADEWREVASVVVCERPVRLRTLRTFHVDERPQEGGERAGVLRRHYYSNP
jgi:hypothetical protein